MPRAQKRRITRDPPHIRAWERLNRTNPDGSYKHSLHELSRMTGLDRKSLRDWRTGKRSVENVRSKTRRKITKAGQAKYGVSSPTYRRTHEIYIGAMPVAAAEWYEEFYSYAKYAKSRSYLALYFDVYDPDGNRLGQDFVVHAIIERATWEDDLDNLYSNLIRRLLVMIRPSKNEGYAVVTESRLLVGKPSTFIQG